MAITKTDILNKALTLVGANPIVSIDDQTNNARVLSRVYETALRSVLSEAKWNFATKRSTLSVLSTTAEWYDTGETILYQKPTDMIRIYGTNSRNASWREEGDVIYSDTTGLGLRYVYYLDDPTKYPTYFIDALIDRLCSDIAYAIVNSSTLGDKYYKIFESVSLPKAQSANAQTGVQQTVQDDAWELAKYSDNPANV
jgi:hypothetical protein